MGLVELAQCFFKNGGNNKNAPLVRLTDIRPNEESTSKRNRLAICILHHEQNDRWKSVLRNLTRDLRSDLNGE